MIKCFARACHEAGAHCHNQAITGSDYCSLHIEDSKYCIVMHCPFPPGPQHAQLCATHFHEWKGLPLYFTIHSWLMRRTNDQARRLAALPPPEYDFTHSQRRPKLTP